MEIINITDEEKNRSYEFAEKIIKNNNQFNRFAKSIDTQIKRTYIGKLAEYVFFHYLISKNILVKEGDMFVIYEGAENADEADFRTKNGNTIDIKTASLPFHKRIMIPLSKAHLVKDYYVGIKLHFNTSNNEIIDPFDISKATIYGYIERETIMSQPSRDFGEGFCKSYLLSDLKPLEVLINKF